MMIALNMLIVLRNGIVGSSHVASNDQSVREKATCLLGSADTPDQVHQTRSKILAAQ